MGAVTASAVFSSVAMSYLDSLLRVHYSRERPNSLQVVPAVSKTSTTETRICDTGQMLLPQSSHRQDAARQGNGASFRFANCESRRTESDHVNSQFLLLPSDIEAKENKKSARHSCWNAWRVRIPFAVANAKAEFDERGELWYIAARCWGRSVVVNMSACQAEDRGFESRCPLPKSKSPSEIASWSGNRLSNSEGISCQATWAPSGRLSLFPSFRSSIGKVPLQQRHFT
jgi:hypothetical protein